MECRLSYYLRCASVSPWHPESHFVKTLRCFGFHIKAQAAIGSGSLFIPVNRARLSQRKRQGLPAKVSEGWIAIEFVSVARVRRNRNLVARIPAGRPGNKRSGHGEAAAVGVAR